MFTPLPTAAEATSLQRFRALLAESAPEARIRVDETAGEVHVRGHFDARAVDEAVSRSGLGLRVIADGGGCCGGCGGG